MIPDVFYNYTGPITNIFATLTALFAFLCFYKLINKKSKVSKLSKVFFGLMAVTSIVFALAELIWIFLNFIGYDPSYGPIELLYMIGYISAIIAFSSLLYYTYKKEGVQKKFSYIVLSSFFFGIVTFYIVYSVIYGFQEGSSTWEMFVDFFYPIASTVLVTVSMGIYLWIKEFGGFAKYVMYLAIAQFVGYFGDLMYTYYVWNDIYGWWGVASDSLYLAYYILTFLAFYGLYKLIK